MREFVNYIFSHDITIFILCYLLTITPICGIMFIHSNKDKNE